MLLRRPLRTALLIVHLVVTVAALGTDLALLALGVAGLRRAADAATGTAAAPLTHAPADTAGRRTAGAAALLTVNVLLGVVKPRLRRPRRNVSASATNRPHRRRHNG